MTERNGDKMSSPSVLRISLKMCSVLECELGRGLGTGGHGSPAKGAEGGDKTAKIGNRQHAPRRHDTHRGAMSHHRNEKLNRKRHGLPRTGEGGTTQGGEEGRQECRTAL